ncbi:MAG: hypothetical protein JRI46_04465 [Deltaproteobacteria bacterium]|nr:hypothetical protein [Deltaproteobacteria bacterium]
MRYSVEELLNELLLLVEVNMVSSMHPAIIIEDDPRGSFSEEYRFHLMGTCE